MTWRAPAGETLYERLWSRIHANPADPVNGCWLWQGEPHSKGYARIQVDGRVVYVHRYLWQEHNRPLGRYEQIESGCATPQCCNPRHWRLRGTA